MTPAEVDPAPPHRKERRPVRICFFAGDLLDWLRAGKSVSGVQRVTMELLGSALDSIGSATTEIVPCVRSPKSGLTPISMDTIRTEIGVSIHGAGATGSRVGGNHVFPPLARRLLASLFQGYRKRPMPIGPNDHVLFTGVVWTPAYQRLFRKLHASGARFSVLVYDIIPIERPDLVSVTHRENFIKWLKTMLSTATVIFVSSHSMLDKLRKCAVIFDVRIKASLVQISFGTTTLLGSSLRQSRVLAGAVQLRPENGFVLSVGTIDKRKNQLALVEIWGRLISENFLDLPRLILLGRLDISLDALTPEGKRAIDSGMVQVLSDQPDEVVASLYRDCLFTVFPSFIEGYGLPVAESLRFGKLCVCSDLAEIREFAGDLAWYFDPANRESAYQMIRSALEAPAKRQEAEQEIARRFVAQPWSSTLSAMIAGIQSASAQGDTGADGSARERA